VEAGTASGVEVDGVHLVDDGVLPPDVGVHPRAGPAGAGEGLAWSAGSEQAGAGQGEDEESASGRHGHRAVKEMLREFVGRA
jgi:hypothetical protein